MFKNFQFDKNYKKIRKRSVYEREIELIHEYITSTHENLCFVYNNVMEAGNASRALAKRLKNERKSVKLMQRKNFVIVKRVKNEE